MLNSNHELQHFFPGSTPACQPAGKELLMWKGKEGDYGQAVLKQKGKSSKLHCRFLPELYLRQDGTLAHGYACSPQDIVPLFLSMFSPVGGKQKEGHGSEG